MSETNMMDGGDHFYKKPRPTWKAECRYTQWLGKECAEWSELRNDKRRRVCPNCGCPVHYTFVEVPKID